MRSWDPAWERVFKQQAWGGYPGEHLIRFIAKNFYAKKRDSVRILDLGCGPGANLWYLAREGFSVCGIDASPTAVRLARERLASEKLVADIREGDILKLPWPDRFFNAVVDVECLFANDAEAARIILSEIRRVLMPGGLLFSQTLSEAMAPETATGTSLQFAAVDQGPHAGKGFMRLSNRQSIAELYGEAFQVASVDRAVRTSGNGTDSVSEWLVVCRKPEKETQ